MRVLHPATLPRPNDTFRSTTMTSPTHACGYVHYDGMATVIGRFKPAIDGYRAVSGGPLRKTRAEAVTDECTATHQRGQ